MPLRPRELARSFSRLYRFNNGRVTAAVYEVEERVVALSGVTAGIASVRRRANRLRSGQKRKAAERKDNET
jgi:hypothetical protein